MSAFEEAAQALFADENMAKAATYRAGGTGTPTPVTVLFSSPFREADFGETGAVIADRIGLVQLSEIPGIARKDTLEIGAITLSVEKVLPDDQGVTAEVTLKKVA